MRARPMYRQCESLCFHSHTIIAGALNLKMAVPRFVNLSEEVVNATEEKSIAKRTKDATEVSRTLFKSKM